MSQKGNKFTGFIATYSNGKKVRQKEDYISRKLKKKMATNWAEIDKYKLQSLELVWNGESKIKIDKKEYPHIKPDDWFFSHTAIFDMDKQKIVIVGRNIGYKKDDIIQVYTIIEENGILKSSIRNA